MASQNQQEYYPHDVPVFPIQRVGTEIDATIAFVRSATSVALHISKYRSMLDSVCEACDTYGNKEESLPMNENDIKVGVLCVAKYEDENWYRCQIVNVDYTTKTALIYFIDYGNSDYIGFAEILPCNPHTVMYPVQAITVRPQIGPDGLPAYTEDELENVCANGAHFNVKIKRCLVHPANLLMFKPEGGETMYEAELIIAKEMTVLEKSYVDGNQDKKREQAEAMGLDVALLEKHVEENQNQEQPKVEVVDLGEMKQTTSSPICSDEKKVTVTAKAVELEFLQTEEKDLALPDVSINTHALTALKNIINTLDGRLLTLEEDQKKDRANQDAFEHSTRDSINKLNEDMVYEIEKIHEAMTRMEQEIVQRIESVERKFTEVKVANDLEKLCCGLVASLEAKDESLKNLVKEKEETKSKMQRTIDELKVQIATETVLRNQAEKFEEGIEDGSI